MSCMRLLLGVGLLSVLTTICYCQGRPGNVPKCPKRALLITAIIKEPYTIEPTNRTLADRRRGVLYDFLDHSLSACFPNCQSAPNMKWTYVREWHELADRISERKADFYLPITTPMRTAIMSNHSLGNKVTLTDGVAKSCGFVFIIDEVIYNERTKALFLSGLVKMWPILALIVLLAGTSGVFIWTLECRTNKEEFPLSFTRGFHDGFWWAFISMTTVGYGDKTPKSPLGRVFGVAFILVGLVVVALFTGSVTSVLTNKPGLLDGAGDETLAVFERTDAKLWGLENGAKVKQYQTFERMNLALQTKESYAILMDKFRAYQYLSSGLYPRLKIYSSVERPIEYAVAVDNTKLKDNPLDSMCLERIWRESHEQADSLVFSYIERLTGKNVSFIRKEDITGILSSDSQETQILLYFLSGVLVACIVLGGLWEIATKRFFTKHRRVNKITVSPPTYGTELKAARRTNLTEIETNLKQLTEVVCTLQANLSIAMSSECGNFGCELHGNNINNSSNGY